MIYDQKSIKNGLWSKMGVFEQLVRNNSSQSEFFNTDFLMHILWHFEANFVLLLQGAPLILKSPVAHIDDPWSGLKFKHIIRVPNQTNKLTDKKKLNDFYNLVGG